MRILKFLAENVKRLGVVEIDTHGESVVLQGANTAGKSSVLDAILYAFAGKRKIPEGVVKEGTGQGSVRIELDSGLIVERVFTEKGTTKLTVTSGKAKYASPQQVLDALLGDLSFDPLAFDRASQKEQVEMLLSALGLEEEIRELEAKYVRVYDERRELNRQLRNHEAELELNEAPAADIPEHEQNIQEVVDKISKAQAENLAIEASHHKKAAVQRKLTDISERISRTRLKLADLEREQREVLQEEEALEGVSLDDRIDLEPLRDELAQIEHTNRRVRTAQKHREVSAAASELRQRSESMTVELSRIIERKAELVGASEVVPGLTFDDEKGVMIDGREWALCSQSQRIGASMRIGMQLNPELRVMLMRDGAFLDDNSLEDILGYADAEGYQLFVETIVSGHATVEMVDGAAQPVGPVIVADRLSEADKEKLREEWDTPGKAFLLQKPGAMPESDLFGDDSSHHDPA